MSHIERLLEALVTPFIDPKMAIEEWKRREDRNIQVAGLSLKAHGTTALKGIRKRSAVSRF
jgi:hypothetical protein